MRLASGAASMLAVAGLSGCSGFPAGFSDLVYVGPDRVLHETFTWYGPIGEVYDAAGNDPRVGRIGPGKICETKRIVNRPNYDEILTEDGESMNLGAYPRTLFSECFEPEGITQ